MTKCNLSQEEKEQIYQAIKELKEKVEQSLSEEKEEKTLLDEQEAKAYEEVKRVIQNPLSEDQKRLLKENQGLALTFYRNALTSILLQVMFETSKYIAKTIDVDYDEEEVLARIQHLEQTIILEFQAMKFMLEKSEDEDA